MTPARRTPTTPQVIACCTLLLLANLGLGSAMSSGTGSTASTTAVCQSELSACLADDTCNACMYGPEPTDFCSQRYPNIFTSGSAGEGAGYDYCEATGATYCCDFEDEATSDQCLTNPASITYWTCVMADEGCEVSDMPCYMAGAVEASTPTPVPAAAPASTSTSDYIIATSSTECQSEISACLADDTCNACMSGPETTDLCSQRYPSNFYTGGGEGAVYDYCDSNGAYYCCDYADEETADRCLTNQASISYWTCKMMDDGCQISDMPCYTTGAVESTSPPASTTPSASSTSTSGDFAPTTPSPITPSASTSTSGDFTPTTPSPISTVEADPITPPTPAPVVEDTEPTTVDFANNGGREATGSPQRLTLVAASFLGAAAGLVVVI